MKQSPLLLRGRLAFRGRGMHLAGCLLFLMAAAVLRAAQAFRTPFARHAVLSLQRRGPVDLLLRRGGATRPSLLTKTMATTSSADDTKAKVKLALCQILSGDDKAANIATARQAVVDAAKDGAGIVALPECWNSPYATSSFPVYAETIPSSAAQVDAQQSPSLAMLLEVARTCGVFLVGGSIPERDSDGQIYNTCVVVGPDGEILAKHRKVHLFDIDVPGRITFKESDTLSPGQAVTVVDTPYGRIGVGICYDIRFPELSMLMRKRGCKLLLFPGAFNLTTGPAHWELLQRARAVDNQVFVAAVSPARNPASSYQAWGHSTVVSPWGEVLATTGHEAATVTVEVDLSGVEEVRRNIPVWGQKRHDLYQLQEVGGAEQH